MKEEFGFVMFISRLYFFEVLLEFYSILVWWALSFLLSEFNFGEERILKDVAQ